MGVDARMLVRTHAPVSDVQIAQWSYAMAEAFGTESFFISRPDPYRPEGCHALERAVIYEQDGPDVHPETGETFLQVSLSGRYYGEGYERGPLPTFLMIAAYLEQTIPGCQVWYGGDSSGICLERFDATRRAALFAHFVKVGHTPYMRGWAISNPQYFCDFCQQPGVVYGGGNRNTFAAVSCPGCGLDVETRDGGVTWTSRTSVMLEGQP
jgi:hypothetical protein